MGLLAMSDVNPTATPWSIAGEPTIGRERVGIETKQRFPGGEIVGITSRTEQWPVRVIEIIVDETRPPSARYRWIAGKHMHLGRSQEQIVAICRAGVRQGAHGIAVYHNGAHTRVVDHVVVDAP